MGRYNRVTKRSPRQWFEKFEAQSPPPAPIAAVTSRLPLAKAGWSIRSSGAALDLTMEI
jgi:hypothetical protein